MAKRFTDTEIWNKAWYRKLPMKHKLFWSYIKDNCDQAGVWDVDLEAASFFIGTKFEAGEVLEVFADQIRPISEEKWWVVGFIQFQYGTNIEGIRSRVDGKTRSGIFVKVLSIVDKHSLTDTLSIPYQYPIDRVQEEEEEEREEEREEKAKDKDAWFNEIWAEYPRRAGKKESRRHFMASVNTEEDWKNIRSALKNYLAHLKRNKTEQKFIQHGKTWFNNWEDWIPEESQPGKKITTYYCPDCAKDHKLDEMCPRAVASGEEAIRRALEV